MVIKTAVALSEWVFKEIIGNTTNKSRRIEELIIKGYMAEKEKSLKAVEISKESMPLELSSVIACGYSVAGV